MRKIINLSKLVALTPNLEMVTMDGDNTIYEHEEIVRAGIINKKQRNKEERKGGETEKQGGKKRGEKQQGGKKKGEEAKKNF